MKTAVKVASEAFRRRQEWSLVIRGRSHCRGISDGMQRISESIIDFDLEQPDAR